MPIIDLITFLLLLFVASLVMPTIASWLRMPTSSLLVLAGFVISELYISQGGDTGIRAMHFQPLIFYVFLPVLIFDAAYHIHASQFLKNLPAILWLAIGGMVLSALLTAVGIYYGISHTAGFPWTTALVCGALLAATDPVAVVTQIRSSGAPSRLGLLLEGESLLNDATAVVLFSLFISLASSQSGAVSIPDALLEFARLFGGGIALGVTCGFAARLLQRCLVDGFSTPILTLLTAYGSFYIGEQWLHVSGIMAVLCAGLVLGSEHQRRHTEEQRRSLKRFWGLLGQLGTDLVFLLMGVTISIAMFTERWLAILIAIGAVTAARFVSTWLSLLAANLTPGSEPVPRAYTPVIIWGGLRGVVAIALALSLPTHIEGWWTVQCIAYGVVAFSLFIQAPTNPLVLRSLIKQNK